MARLFLLATCFILLLAGSFADVEHEEHGGDHAHHHHAHDGHDHHSPDAHKKLFTGDGMRASLQDSEEQDEKLRLVANRIDTDQSGKVSRDEMHVFVKQRLTELEDREADDLIATLDPQQTGKISFEAYAKEYFGDIDVDKISSSDKKDASLRESRRLYRVDKEKWDFLDTDGDGALSHNEFRLLLQPEEDDDLRRIEINSIMNEYDEDNNGKISNAEYKKMTEAETGQSEMLTTELDHDDDGYADFEEMSQYYLPKFDSSVDEETDHLMKECDADKDGECTIDEVVKAYTAFAASQVTDFGADLERPLDEL